MGGEISTNERGEGGFIIQLYININDGEKKTLMVY